MESGGGDDHTLIGTVIGCKNRVCSGIENIPFGAAFIGDADGAGLLRRELEVHGDLAGVAFCPVHGRTQSDDSTAVDKGSSVGVQTGIRDGLGSRDDSAAVDDQITVGIDAIAFLTQACYDAQCACIDGGDGNIVFVGVDAVVAGQNGDVTTVDGQVQLGVQTLVVRVQGQLAGAIDVHGHIGIDGAVLLPQLLCAVLILVDLGHIGAGDGVFTLEDQVGTGSRSIHIRFGGVFAPVAVALIDIHEENSGGYGAGDVCVVQNQFHQGIFIVIGIVTQINADLTCGEFAGDPVGAGCGDIDHIMLFGLFCGALISGGAFAVGIAAFVGVFVFVVDDIVGGKDGQTVGAGDVHAGIC